MKKFVNQAFQRWRRKFEDEASFADDAVSSGDYQKLSKRWGGEALDKGGHVEKRYGKWSRRALMVFFAPIGGLAALAPSLRQAITSGKMSPEDALHEHIRRQNKRRLKREKRGRHV